MPKINHNDIDIQVLSAEVKITKEMMDLLLLADPDPRVVRAYAPGIKTLLAYHRVELVGIAVLTKHDKQFELKNIAVKEGYQGLGVGKKLIQAIKTAAKVMGADSLLVGTGNSSFSQLALYQKCGFRFCSIKKDFFAEYVPPIIENGIRCLDMLMLQADLSDN